MMEKAWPFLALAFLVASSLQADTEGKAFVKSRTSARGPEGLTVEEMIACTTKGEKGILLTVGTLVGGEVSFSVHGQDAALLEPAEHAYEIGSITKVFTAALLCRALDEGIVRLDEPVCRFFPLPGNGSRPTLGSLATHTSGYGQRLGFAIMLNSVLGRNPYLGFGHDELTRALARIRLPSTSQTWEYSNFGFAVLGEALGKAHNATFKELMEGFLSDDLGLARTRFGSPDSPQGWQWKDDDVYLAAGGLVSTVKDLLAFAKTVIDGSIAYLGKAQEEMAEIGRPEVGGMRFDATGLAWIIDKNNRIIWHNGGTDSCNAYIGMDLEKRTAVVVLVNRRPSFRIPACVIGARLLKGMHVSRGP